jgi:hypothetical protein
MCGAAAHMSCRMVSLKTFVRPYGDVVEFCEHSSSIGMRSGSPYTVQELENTSVCMQEGAVRSCRGPGEGCLVKGSIGIDEQA